MFPAPPAVKPLSGFNKLPVRTATKPTATPAKPTATLAKPTATPAKPTATPAKPTATPAKPTATPPKPTATPAKPTATTVKPTASPVIPTTATPKLGLPGTQKSSPPRKVTGTSQQAQGKALQHKKVETRPIDVTINVPSPSEPFPQSQNYLSTLGREELISSLMPSSPYEPLIGDVKLTLDDLKSSLLKYYANLYEPEGRSINEKLDFLQQHFYPSPYPISGALPSSVGLPAEDQPRVQSVKVLNSSVSHPFGTTGLYNPNFVGVLNPVTAPPPGELMLERLEHTGLTSTQKSNPEFPPVRQGINELLGDVRQDMDLASRRLVGLSGLISAETENPNLRTFNYLNYPKAKRRPRFGTQDEMEKHMTQLYSDLYSQLEWNEKSIKALRHRLSVLQRSAKRTGEEPMDSRLGW